MWDLVMPGLSTGRRVFAYDIRGHGSAAGAPVPAAMTDTGADLLGVDQAHVVGLSYGGGIAQAAAVTAPDRFASLALLATTDHPFSRAAR
jgi:3-oxoadipate enol-lactonase